MQFSFWYIFKVFKRWYQKVPIYETCEIYEVDKQHSQDLNQDILPDLFSDWGNIPGVKFNNEDFCTWIKAPESIKM